MSFQVGAGGGQVGAGGSAFGSDTGENSGDFAFGFALDAVATVIPNPLRFSQLTVETVSSPPVPLRVSQLSVETITSAPVPIRMSQLVIETITRNSSEQIGAFMGDGGGACWIE